MRQRGVARDGPPPPPRRPAARSAMGAAAVAAHSPRSSLASSSFSSSSGLQSGRAAPLTVSVPRPARPPARLPAREGPPARPRRRTPGAQGGGLGPRRVGESTRAGQGPAARGPGPPSCRAWRGRAPGATRRGGRLRGQARRPTVQAAQPSSRLVVSPRLAARQARPSRSPPPGCALPGTTSSVLCTLSAGVWRRPELPTQPTRLFTHELNPNGVRRNNHNCLLLDARSFLSTFLVKGNVPAPLLSPREGL